MTLARVRKSWILWSDTILLIGGALLAAEKDNLAAETAAFARTVAEHDFGRARMTETTAKTPGLAHRCRTFAGRASSGAPIRMRRARRTRA